jgi:MFS family permease
MFGKYVSVLRVPGAARFSVTGFIGRFQMSMIGLGAVLLLQHERGSYAIAGAVSAIYALSMAVISPQVSRLIDAWGQRKVVPIQLFVHLPAMAVLILLAMNDTPEWSLFALAFVAGASQPNIGPLVRARWSKLLTGTGSLRTAFAWESLLDEVIFIAGPPLATVLALSLFPSAALVVATVLLAIGTMLFLAQRGTEPPPSGATEHRGQRPAIALPGVAAVALVYVLIGGVFGAWEVTTVAFAQQQGHAGAAGVLLAVYSLGSLCGGLVFGALTLRASMLRQFLFVLALMAVVTLPLPLLGNVWLLGLGALVAGIAVAPVLISGMSLIERIVPMSRLTESMSWPSAGLAVGLAVASPLAGVIVDAHSASTAYWITSGCAVGAAVVGFALLGSLRRANVAASGRIAAGTQVAARV